MARMGGWLVLYREKTDNERDMYVAVMDQNRRGQNRCVIASAARSGNIPACPMTYFTINRAGTGYVAGMAYEGAGLFRAIGQGRQGAATRGNQDAGQEAAMRNGLLALSAPDGATLVAWKNLDVLGWQLYDANGQPQGGPGSGE